MTAVMCLFIINKKKKEIQKKRNIKLRKMLVFKYIIISYTSPPVRKTTSPQ